MKKYTTLFYVRFKDFIDILFSDRFPNLQSFVSSENPACVPDPLLQQFSSHIVRWPKHLKIMNELVLNVTNAEHIYINGETWLNVDSCIKCNEKYCTNVNGL